VSPVSIGPARSTVARNETVTHSWFVLDAGGYIVGRLATQIATVLMGKHRPDYTPHVDTGDYVVVLNAHLVRFSGKSLAHDTHPQFTQKFLWKQYQKYTGYPSGRRLTSAAVMLEKAPERILHEAVRRMLPKNKLGRQMLKKLKIYCSDEHTHQAQNPQPFPEYLLPPA
jgi:large subunit ribosomal protein L13